MTRGDTLHERVLVVPHGLGIGDLVNERPLLSAIAAHYKDREVQVLASPALAWLLPPGVQPAPALAGVRLWERPGPNHMLTALGRGATVRATGQIAQMAPVRALVSGLSAYLRLLGYGTVISLLDRFHHLDLNSRWTEGPWNLERRHLIDLLADDLERDGVTVSSRRPRLDPEYTHCAVRPDVLITPNAGSMLKEPPVAFWVTLTRALVAEGRTPWLISAPGRDTAARIAAEVPQAHIMRAADLRLVAAWIAAARVVVAPDTGVLHLAAAFGTPYVGLYGATDPVFLGPYPGTAGTILLTPAAHEPVCRRCWTGQLLPVVRCPLYQAENCLAGIDPVDVLVAIKEMWAEIA
ncbi:MAG: glycosyltransferase family 9 protein [Chloroflexota bacterium]|nr:glycosyltransferase family 9 protein [Chloroflexota bacterium]